MKFIKAAFCLLLLSLCLVIASCGGDKSGEGATNNTTTTAVSTDKNVCLLSYTSKGQGVKLPDSVSCRVGSEVTLATAPERKFYIFKGWSDGKNCYQPGQSMVINQKTDLEALWELDRSAAISSEYLTFSAAENGECSLTGFKESGFVGVYLEIPESDGKGNKVTAIASSAFENNTALAGVKLGENIRTVGKRAFHGCTALESIEFSNGLEIIDEYAFYYCISLEKLTLPETLKSVMPYAFRNCSGLLRLTLPQGLESVGESAFRGCLQLAVVDCPLSLKVLGDHSFAGCSALRNVNYDGSQEQWNKIKFGEGNESFEKGATFAL